MATSENAKHIVAFLSKLESDNIDLIKETKSISKLGWATDKNFIPGFEGDITLDIDPSMKIYRAQFKLIFD